MKTEEKGNLNQEMKDVTSTSFGLVIAYLLPGLAGLYTLSFFCEPIQKSLATFLSASSNIGLFLLVTLSAIAIGLQVTIVRWLFFECIFCRSHRLTPNDFAKLSTEGRLTAFRAAVDEHYRYHQFWGGMAIILPFLYFGARTDPRFSSLTTSKLSRFLFFAIELVTIAAGIVSYLKYTERSKSILIGGNNNAERMGQEESKEEGEKSTWQEESKEEEKEEIEET